MDNGWFFPIDSNDAQGDRPYAGSPFWLNQSIELTELISNASVSVPNAEVGKGYGFSLKMARVAKSEQAAECEGIQIWVCYPNTAPAGQTPKSMVVSSMQNKGGVLSTSVGAMTQGVVFVEYSELTIGPNGAAYNAWRPTTSDILNAPTSTAVNPGEVHACILVNSHGKNGASNLVGVKNIDPSDPMHVNPDTQPTAGQRNLAILGANQKIFFPFLSGLSRKDSGNAIEVTAEWLPPKPEIDAIIAEAYRKKGYGNLEFIASANKPPVFGLVPNSLMLDHQFLKDYFSSIEADLKQYSQTIDRLSSRSKSGDPSDVAQYVKIPYPTGGIFPFLFFCEFHPSDPPGSVHYFDIKQVDRISGSEGGIRLAVIRT